jgi:hypothetical protein
MQGITLSRRFYAELVAPFLAERVPGMAYAAALFGFGSDVLGYDDEMSRDHNWGPRVHIIVSEADFDTHARDLVMSFIAHAPQSLHGEPIAWRSRPHPPANRRWAAGDMAHGLEIHTLAGRLEDHFARSDLNWSGSDWLGVPEQKLLEFGGGEVFRDDTGELIEARTTLDYLPDDVWHFKIAAQWARIGEEQAFVGRTGMNGDDIGSRIIAARLVRDLMRLAYLLERQYVPYAKWFGTGFAQLSAADKLRPALARVLSANYWGERESALADAYLMVAQLQKAPNIAPFEAKIGPYHERGFLTINVEAAVEAALGRITDPELKARFPFGGIDQLSDATPVLERAPISRRVNIALAQ